MFDMTQCKIGSTVVLRNENQATIVGMKDPRFFSYCYTLLLVDPQEVVDVTLEGCYYKSLEEHSLDVLALV